MDVVHPLPPMEPLPGTPGPRGNQMLKILKYIYNTICCKQAKHFYTALYILISIIPIVSSILEIILIANRTCIDKTGESIVLGIMTHILFFSTLFIIYRTEGRLNYLLNTNVIPRTALVWFTMFYFIVYGVVIHIFGFGPITCSEDTLWTNLLHYLLIIWIMEYSVILLTVLIGILCEMNNRSECSEEAFITMCAIFCQFGIVLIPSSLQIVLIKYTDCNGAQLMSMLETVLLPILTFFGCIFVIATFATKDSVLFSLCWLILCITYGFIIHSCLVWGDQDIDCGEKQAMKTAAFVFFVILGVEYGIITIITTCFGCIYRISVWGE